MITELTGLQMLLTTTREGLVSLEWCLLRSVFVSIDVFAVLECWNRLAGLGEALAVTEGGK